ncbi:MAG: hypothetical protein U0Q22_13765 [Acidimicrobiales bacterium]
MNDDQFESHLRAGLHRRAADIDAAIVPSAVVADDARARTARRQHRRMATASIATVAAVAVGFVVITRDPAAVGADEYFAGAELPGLAAGAATGSSTGSATGSPTGWTTFGGATPADDSKLLRYRCVRPE